MALSNNLLLKARKMQSAAGNDEIKIKQAAYYPNLTLSGSYDDQHKLSNSLTFSEPNPYRLHSYTAELDVLVYDGQARKKDIDLAKNSRAMLELTENESRRQLIERITLLFFDIISSERSLDLYKNNLNTHQKNLHIAEEKLKTGDVKIIDVKNFQLRIQEAQLKISDFEKRIETSKMEMSQILNAPSTFWESVQKLTYSMPEGLDQWDENHLLSKSAQSPSIRKARHQVHHSDLERKKHLTRRIPTLNATATFGNENQNHYSGSRGGEEYSFQLTLSWGLTNLLTSRLQASKSKASKVAYQHLLDNEKNTENTKLKKHLHQIQIYQKKSTLYESSRALSREKRDITRESYQSGQADMLELNLAESELLQAELMFSQSKLEYDKSIHILNSMLQSYKH